MPFEAFITSPGCTADPFIIFSQAATIKCISNPSGFIAPSALAAPRTAALPPMSYFIISIWEAPTFRLYPPESKVKPLPTNAIFSFTGLFDFKVKCINLGSKSEPLATAKYAPIPKSSHSFFSRILISKPWSLAIFEACIDISSGVRLFGGAATSLLASSTPSQIYSVSLKSIFLNLFKFKNSISLRTFLSSLLLLNRLSL